MKIVFFALSNFFEVQGATEPYYVYKHFRERHQAMAFVPDSGKRPASPDIKAIKPWPGVPTFLWYNLKILPYLFRTGVRTADAFYIYKGVITPVLVLKFLLRKKWISDFQTSPVAQELEFKRLHGKLSPFRRGVYALGKAFYHLTLHRCDLIIAISEEVKRELIEEYRVSPHKIHVQPLGVDLELFAPRAEPPDPREEFRLVYIGAIAAQRGLDVVLRALAELVRQQGVPARFAIVGRGSAEAVQSLKGLAEKLEVSERVEWWGFVPHEEIPRILERCHVALSPLPPLRAYEVSSPAKLFEYLAMGKVVIATDILAHRKIIRHGENGLLVPPQDPEALARAIVEVYHDEDLRRRLSENARESVKPYSWNRMLEELERRVREFVP